MHIDVRGLSPPEPFFAIMDLVREQRGPIVVHHERDPVPLYEALDAAGWDWNPLPSPEGEVRLRLVPRG